MSKSTKRNPVVSDYNRGSTNYYKRVTSKTVRRYKGAIQDGRSFKKLYQSYNIHDYVSWELVSDENFRHPDRNPEDYYGTTHKDLVKYCRK